MFRPITRRKFCRRLLLPSLFLPSMGLRFPAFADGFAKKSSSAGAGFNDSFRKKVAAAAPAPSFDPHFFGDLQALGLDGTCELCLDAGEITSYETGQKLLDLAGNGIDFFLGADGDVSTDDPTFNGVAGDLSSSEFFGFDGGDVFTYDTTNAAFMDAWHKDLAQFTILIWAFPGTVADEHWWFGTGSATSGISFRTFPGGTSRLNVYNGVTSILEKTTTGTIADSAWHLIGVSIDEAGGAGASLHYFDGAAETFDGAYGTADTGNASNPMEIGGRPGTGSPNVLLNGDQVAGFMAFSSALTEAQIDTIWERQKTRFGL